MAQKPKYRVDTHYFPGSTDSERESFREGVESVQNRPYLHAYYAGVGYAKGSKRKAMGFKNDEEKARFDAGMEEEHRHYMVLKKPKPKGFLSKLFKKMKNTKKKEVARKAKPRYKADKRSKMRSKSKAKKSKNARKRKRR